MKKKHKILYVVEAMGGGVFTYIVEMANRIVEDYELYIAYATRPQTPHDYKEYFDERVQLIEIKSFTRSIHLTKDVSAINELRKLVKKVEPDIVHLHSSKAGVLGRITLPWKRGRVFYTPHGYSFLMSDCNNKKRMLYKTMENIMSKTGSKTISCSLGEHQETVKMTKNAMYINNGINIARMTILLEKFETKDHPFTVFTLGRICYQKNPALFNEIALSMPEIRFLWIGDGELREELTAPNIEITGWVDRKTALTYSMNADVFLLPSRWEGLPISLLEAMFMKKLCVVSDVIGNRDVIYNEKNGFVCNSLEEYKTAILQGQEKNVDHLIETAYTEILNEYNTDVMSRKYYKEYENAINMAR